MSAFEISINHLPSHVTITPDQLAVGRLPQISEIGFFNGCIGVNGPRNNPADKLYLSLIAASAADVTPDELKAQLGATPNSRLGQVLDGAYNRLPTASPETVGRMVSRAWQRQLLYTREQLTDLPELEYLTDPLLRILGAVSCGETLKDIASSVEFADIHVEETLAEFRAGVGIRSLAGAISFARLSGRLGPTDHPSSSSLSPAEPPVTQPAITLPKSPTLAPIAPMRAAVDPVYTSNRISRPPDNPTQRFNIPPELRVLKRYKHRPKGEGYPERLGQPILERSLIHWGGGVFKANLPDDPNIKLLRSRALILSCFDQTSSDIATNYDICKRKSNNVRASVSVARELHDLPIELAQTVEALFSRGWLSVLEYMPAPTNSIYEKNLDIIKSLPTRSSTPKKQNGKIVAPPDSRVLHRTFRSFGVTTCCGLLTRAYGLGIWVPEQALAEQTS